MKFLQSICVFRKKSSYSLSVEVIILACYILGLHKNSDESLEIWKAKNTDFDTFASIDIQLIAFMGIEHTLTFLKNQSLEIGLKNS